MTVFLTLGDGDFSYSVDLFHYLSTLKQLEQNTLIVTGVDSLEDMRDKYKDCNYLLRRLARFNADNDDKLVVDIRHEINAVSSHSTTISADVVIFNHPHLGTEDAARHARFLNHFLNECNNSWLNSANNDKTGTVHLTLAAGQWERWQGEKAASKHGFLLNRRLPFRSPPVKEPKYQHRRHQTGKSFQNRTTGSETFVLVRSKEENAFIFAWQAQEEDTLNQVQQQPLFQCSECERGFKEQRSLNSHMKAVHGEGSNKKRKLETKCCHCESQGVAKIFSQEAALQAHIQAKHSGPHTTILPEWAEKKGEAKAVEVSHGCCNICDHVFRTADDALRHSKEFLPSDVPSSCVSFSCQFCSKTFSDQRGQLQHENFCKKRKELGQRNSDGA